MDPIEKYPRQSSFIIDNLQDLIAENGRNRRILPTPIKHFPKCRMMVYRDGRWINCSLYFTSFKRESKVRMRIFMRLVNKDPKKSEVFEIEKEVESLEDVFEKELNIAKIMNFENGWLIDEKLTFQCGTYLKAIMGKDGIWKFNFWDPLFDCEEKQHMITLNAGDGELLYTHKQLLTFHSPKYYTIPPDWNIVDQYNSEKENLEICLQLAHGVRMKLDGTPYFLRPSNLESSFSRTSIFQKQKSIIPIARSMKLYNVVHYCQYQLMTFEESLENLKFAFEFNTRHYSIHLMKKLETREELKQILMGMDIQKMSGESMKKCAKFIFDGKI